MGDPEALPAAFVAQSLDEDPPATTGEGRSPDGQPIGAAFLKGARSDEGVDPTHQDATPRTAPPPAAVRWRLALALTAPPCLLMLLWWSWAMAAAWAGRPPLPGLFTDPVGDGRLPTYGLAGIMLVGAMLAGATLDGSVAVAFPAVTLAAGLDPILGRDFALTVNATGGAAFATALLLMGRRHETIALGLCSASGAVGVVLGIEFLAPRLGPSYAKMAFPAAWAAFAFALLLLNRRAGRRDFERVANMGGRVLGLPWRPAALIAAGLAGGLLTSVFGSGADIAVFLALTLLFRVSDEVAGPTCVAVAAFDAAVGVAYRQGAMGGAEDEAWRLFAACIPAVALAMPLGFALASRLRRGAVEGLVCLLAAGQLIAAWVVVPPWGGGAPTGLMLTSVAILAGGAAAVGLVDAGGRKLGEAEEKREKLASLEAGVPEKGLDGGSPWPTQAVVLSVWRIPDEEGGEAAVQYV